MLFSVHPMWFPVAGYQATSELRGLRLPYGRDLRRPRHPRNPRSTESASDAIRYSSKPFCSEPLQQARRLPDIRRPRVGQSTT